MSISRHTLTDDIGVGKVGGGDSGAARPVVNPSRDRKFRSGLLYYCANTCRNGSAALFDCGPEPTRRAAAGRFWGQQSRHPELTSPCRRLAQSRCRWWTNGTLLDTRFRIQRGNYCVQCCKDTKAYKSFIKRSEKQPDELFRKRRSRSLRFYRLSRSGNAGQTLHAPRCRWSSFPLRLPRALLT
jgi:hypothetical protein